MYLMNLDEIYIQIVLNLLNNFLLIYEDDLL